MKPDLNCFVSSAHALSVAVFAGELRQVLGGAVVATHGGVALDQLGLRGD